MTAELVTSAQPIEGDGSVGGAGGETNRGGRGCQTLHFFMCDPNVSCALIIYPPHHRQQREGKSDRDKNHKGFMLVLVLLVLLVLLELLLLVENKKNESTLSPSLEQLKLQ